MNEKWTFYKLGITGNANGTNSSNQQSSSLKLGDLVTFDKILDMTKMRNRVIDVFKMDIEGGEKGVLKELDMTYACKYIKQIMFETHMNVKFEEMVKLEKCFFLFKRDTRFYMSMKKHAKYGYLSEFQLINGTAGFKLDLTPYRDDVHLAQIMFANGELYFINRNFFNFF